MDYDPKDPDRLGFPVEETCQALVGEPGARHDEDEDGDEELCGEPATQYRLFCDMSIPYCDEHAAEIDEMSPEERGNT